MSSRIVKTQMELLKSAKAPKKAAKGKSAAVVGSGSTKKASKKPLSQKKPTSWDVLKDTMDVESRVQHAKAQRNKGDRVAQNIENLTKKSVATEQAKRHMQEALKLLQK